MSDRLDTKYEKGGGLKYTSKFSERKRFTTTLVSRAARLGAGSAMLLALVGCASAAPPAQTPEATAQQSESQAAVETSEETAAAEGTFKVSVTNFDDNPEEYAEFEVWIRNSGSWFPSFEFGGDLLESVGPFPVGELVEGDMYIYPFGRDGLEVSVPILLAEDHISDSDRDMLRIYIEGGVLTIFGVVEGLEITQDLG